jgi:glycosyltransferase involved in cell wall biosynthesis
MTHIPISVTIITYNEESNLARALLSVQWADEVVVVDSGSTDRTKEIAEKFSKVPIKFIHHPWSGYGQQKNFAQNQAKNHWVLNLDADEEVSSELAEEIKQRMGSVDSQTKGFMFPRKTYFLGRWIKFGGWYPNYLVRLVDKRHAAWTEPNVHEALKVDGGITIMTNAITHYSFPTISKQIQTNLRFSYLGSRDLIQRGADVSVFQLVTKPIGKFLETYLIKRGFLDGLRGFIISVNAAYSMFLKYAYALESKIKNEDSHSR